MSINDVGADWMHTSSNESRKRVRNRLSQRRHRAKVRQQTQGPSIPSETIEIDGNLSDEYISIPLDLTAVDDTLDTLTNLSVQHGWEINSGIGAIQMGPTHQLDSYKATHHSQRGWADASRSVDQQDMVTMEYPTGTSIQAGDPSFMALPSAPLRPSTFPIEPWNTYGVSEPQWTNTTASRLPSKPPVSAFSGVGTSTPVLEVNPQQTSTQEYQRPPSPYQEHQCITLQRTPADNSEDSPSSEIEHSHFGHNNKKRSRGICPNTGTQRLTSPSEFDSDQPLPYMNVASRQKIHGSSGKATSSDAHAPSSLPRLHTQHSHCRCRASDPPRNYYNRPITPSTSIPSPTSDVVNVTPHRRSSSHADPSPGHQLTLRDLVQQNMPGGKEYRSSLQSSRRPKKVRKCSFTDSSALEEPSLESELGRGQGIEKVVIVYLKDGDILK